MTADDIIRMAEQVYGRTDFHESALFHLTEFAKLVAAAEREACAKVCYDLMLKENPYGRWEGMKWCMEAIRARGKAV